LEFTDINAALKSAVRQVHCVRCGAVYADILSLLSKELHQHAAETQRQAKLFVTVIGPTLAFAIAGGAAATALHHPRKQDDQKEETGSK